MIWYQIVACCALGLFVVLVLVGWFKAARQLDAAAKAWHDRYHQDEAR